jgi:hypothetical protein
MKANELRYFVTDVVSIPVYRIAKKSEAYRTATGAGWGIVDWRCEVPDQAMYCDEDSSAVLYPKYGREYCIFPGEEINPKDLPKQAETGAIIIGDSCGYSFWAKETGDVKIFVTYDENGLIDTYRLDNWNGKPYDGEIEISFFDLQSEDEHDKTDRAEIVGTFEHERKLKGVAA